MGSGEGRPVGHRLVVTVWEGVGVEVQPQEVPHHLQAAASDSQLDTDRSGCGTSKKCRCRGSGPRKRLSGTGNGTRALLPTQQLGRMGTTQLQQYMDASGVFQLNIE